MNSLVLRPLWIALLVAAMLLVAPFNNSVAQSNPPPFDILSITYRDLDGDHDAFPDTGETGRVAVTVKNTGSITLTGVTFILTSSDPNVDCITVRQVCVGPVAPGQDAMVGSTDPQQSGFTFRASNSLSTTSATSPATVHLCLQVEANEIQGLSDPICFDLLADLNLPPGATQTFITGPDGTPDSGCLLETFDVERDNVAGISINDVFRMTDAGTGLTEHASYLNGNNMGSGSKVCPGYDPCSLDPDFPMDWHLHCTPGSTCANSESGACVGGCSYDTPSNGRKAHSCPDPTNGPCNSLHMGAHFTGDALTGDTTHLRTLQGFLSGPINLALQKRPGDLVMSMYQIADLMDDHGVNTNTGQCADCADVQIQVDQDPNPAVDSWGPWQKLVPFQNVYDHTPNSAATFGSSYCEFTPTDTTPADSMCFASQPSAWSHCGSVRGISSTTTFDCAGPGEVDPSGSGVWVQTKFDLSSFLGQRVRMRWVGSSWQFDTLGTGSYFEYGAGWSGTPHDDGWWLDDIKITGVVTGQVTPTVDTAPPPATTCPTGLCDQVVCVACDQCHDAGTCDPGTGLCSNPTHDCDDQNPCTIDSCDPVSGCAHVAGNAGTVCRAAVDACDQAEVCDGANVTCPADSFVSSGTVCRASAGSCDVAEICNGNSPSCPPDGFRPAGIVCRNTAGVCDVAESCTGSGPSCPGNAFVPGGTVCRASAGPCDVPESCTGSGPSCPGNAFVPGGNVCRASAGPCDVPESCTGGGPSCPANAFVPGGNVCRAAAGPCDIPESCTGGGPSCPGNAFVPGGTVCRASAGPCDVPESCTGGGPSCPANAFVPGGNVCRASAGPCDVPESCTGSGPSCPGNAFVPGGTTCRASAGPCDVAESCTGGGPSCPGNAFVPGGTVCRASAGDCDGAETCTGSSSSCPGDALAPATKVCRPKSDLCDVKENCTGSSPSCPPDSFTPAGTVCRNKSGACDVAESCTGSGPSCPSDSFTPAGTVCRNKSGACDVAESCTGSGASCPLDAFVPGGTVCRGQAGPCDISEFCSGSNPSCPTNSFAPAGSACGDPTATQCTNPDTCSGGPNCLPNNLPNGSACNDGNPFTSNDHCQGGTCV